MANSRPVIKKNAHDNLKYFGTNSRVGESFCVKSKDFTVNLKDNLTGQRHDSTSVEEDKINCSSKILRTTSESWKLGKQKNQTFIALCLTNYIHYIQ